MSIIYDVCLESTKETSFLCRGISIAVLFIQTKPRGKFCPAYVSLFRFGYENYVTPIKYKNFPRGYCCDFH